MSRIHHEQRRPRNIFPGHLDIADRSDQRRCRGHGTRRRGNNRWFNGALKYRATDQIRYKIFPRRQRHPLLERNQHIQPAKFLRLRNRGATLEVEHALPGMVPVHPERFQPGEAWLRLSGAVAQEHFLDCRDSFGKIGEQFRRDLALVPSWPKHSRERNPAVRFAAQSSSISSVKRLCTFTPAAPNRVRTAFAVRP